MKNIFHIEYVLGKISPSIIWKQIGSSAGLEYWFADRVDENGNLFTFHWGKSSQTAKMLLCKSNSHIRFQWDDEEDKKSYFEMKLSTSEISQDITLIITDFSESDEDLEELTTWWNSKIESLQKMLGV